MKIVILDGYTENPGDLSWEGFEALGELTVYDRTAYDKGNDEIIERAKGAEVIIVNKTPIDKETLDALQPELQYIGVLATGYNVIDTEAAKAYGIPVSNIPSYGTTAVAQFVMALVLELCHHVGLHSASVKEGEWTKSDDFSYWKRPLIELRNKTMGIVGYGRIGKAAAELASAFGMRILANDPDTINEQNVRQVPLDLIWKESDIISLHCPLFPDTENLINPESIAKMKNGVFIINTSRGQLIDEEALAEALRSGKVAGAGLDVLREEPPKPDNPLLQLDNCYITPHIAWAPKESRQRLMDTAVENLRMWQKGSPQNIVNN